MSKKIRYKTSNSLEDDWVWIEDCFAQQPPSGQVVYKCLKRFKHDENDPVSAVRVYVTSTHYKVSFGSKKLSQGFTGLKVRRVPRAEFSREDRAADLEAYLIHLSDQTRWSARRKSLFRLKLDDVVDVILTDSFFRLR